MFNHFPIKNLFILFLQYKHPRKEIESINRMKDNADQELQLGRQVKSVDLTKLMKLS